MSYIRISDIYTAKLCTIVYPTAEMCMHKSSKIPFSYIHMNAPLIHPPQMQCTQLHQDFGELTEGMYAWNSGIFCVWLFIGQCLEINWLRTFTTTYLS